MVAGVFFCRLYCSKSFFLAFNINDAKYSNSKRAFDYHTTHFSNIFHFEYRSNECAAATDNCKYLFL